VKHRTSPRLLPNFESHKPALSRQVRDLEEEIGVQLLRRSPRGVRLTAEGRLFLQEVRELLNRTGESVEKVRALVRGEYSELRVGYSPTLAVEILPPGLAAFRKSVPTTKVLLYELSSDKLLSGLRDRKLDLAIMHQLKGMQTAGIEFESLRTYPLCVAVVPAHPFTRLKSVPLEKVAAEPLIGLSRREHPEFHRNLNHIFAAVGVKPRFAVECDTTSSVFLEVEAGHGIALFIPILKLVTGKSLLYRPVTGTTELASIGIARATKGDLTPAGEKFCEILRKTSAARPMPSGESTKAARCAGGHKMSIAVKS
jgi:DNA-binding transcriptional LysR family regulator